MLDLVLEEKLDQLDPLRHLRNDDDEDDPAASVFIPAQPPSILNQSIELSFPTTADIPNPIVIKLALDASPGCGGIAWPAGEVLSRYIARRGSLRGRTVLELGSGTGLVGLVAGKLGADVWITDQAPLLPIMQRNVAENALSASVHIAELNWSVLSPASDASQLIKTVLGQGAPLPSDIPRPGLIIAADCVYFEPAFPLLVHTLAELVQDGSTEVLFCYKKRRKADKRFFSLLKKEFTWTEVDDDPDRETYARQAISLLRLIRKR